MSNKINNIYDGSILNVDGIDFQVTIEPDELCGPPWEECNGHGHVSDWTTGRKRPGELVLCEDRGFKRYYDFQEAVRTARRDGWNTAPYAWKTKGEQAAAAALEDYRYLKRWCDDEWRYVVVTVHPLDDFGDPLPMAASLGGVAYDWNDTSYIECVVRDLAWEVINEHSYMFASPLPRIEEVIAA